jgi:hypothetical protein
MVITCGISDPEDDKEKLIVHAVLYCKNPETYTKAFENYGLDNIQKIYDVIDSISDRDLKTEREKLSVRIVKSNLEKLIERKTKS